MSDTWYALIIGLWLFALLLAFVQVAVLRQLGLIHLRLEHGLALVPPQPSGLAVGSTAPPLSGKTLDGNEVLLDMRHGARTLLAFVSPECRPCVEFARILVDALPTLLRNATVPVVVAHGDREAVRQFGEVMPTDVRVLISNGHRPLEEYQIPATPWLYLVDDDGKIIKSHSGVVDKHHFEDIVSPSQESLKEELPWTTR